MLLAITLWSRRKVAAGRSASARIISDWLQVPADLVGVAGLGFGFCGCVAEGGNVVAEGDEIRDLALNVLQTNV